MNEERKIEVEEVAAAPTPPRARVTETFERKRDYLAGFLAGETQPKEEWTLPGPFDLGIEKEFFSTPDWRAQANLSSGAALLIKEKAPKRYGKKRK